MSCYHPNVAFPVGLTDSGKVKYLIKGFSGEMDLVDNWHSVDVSTGELLNRPPLMSKYIPEIGKRVNPKIVPCGQCIGCRMDYSRTWANRCMMELQYHKESYFLTLTYDPEHLPLNFWVLDGQMVDSMTLKPKDLQDFIKRVRSDQVYRFGESKLRFYACGEYGDQTQRPHYHMIAFGLHLDDLETGGKTGAGFQYFRSKKLQELWKNGIVGIAPVTWETCAYVSRYILKKQTGQNKEIYQALHLYPEFVRMSRRPGIAAQWYEDHKDKIYDYDVINLSTEQRGIKFKPPRYFDQKYDIEYHDDMERVKKARERASKALLSAKMADFSGSYLEMLDNEEREFHDRTKSLRRNLL